MTGYLLEVKYFPNIVTPQRPRGVVATTTGGISLRVRPRVNNAKTNIEIVNWRNSDIVLFLQNLTGNRNIRSWYRNEFEPPIKTRSIRIYPKDPLAVMMNPTAPVVPCLRLELYGCSAPGE